MTSLEKKISALPSTSLFNREERQILREIPIEYRKKNRWFKVYTDEERDDALRLVKKLNNLEHEGDWVKTTTVLSRMFQMNPFNFRLFCSYMYLIEKNVMSGCVTDARRLELIQVTLSSIEKIKDIFRLDTSKFFRYDTPTFSSEDGFLEFMVKN